MRNSNVGLVAAVGLLLAVTGCNNNPPHLVDAFVPPTDMGPGVDAFHVPVDMGPGVDMGSQPGSCTYGGGCNLTDTASCPNDAAGNRQGCYPDDTAPMCHTAGTALAGAACANLNDCDAGNICLSTNVCAKLCCANSDCATGESCNPLNDSTGTALPNHVGVCIRPTACTPLPESGCTGTNHCYVTGSDGSTDCVPLGTATTGQSCDGASNCASGLGCYGTGMPPTFTCSRYCRLGMGTTSNPDCTDSGMTTCHAAQLGTMFGICGA